MIGSSHLTVAHDPKIDRCIRQTHRGQAGWAGWKTPDKTCADLAATEHQFSEHDFAYLELRAARAYLERRVAITKVKQEHGLLTEEEQDALILEAAELKADIELWRQYR